ESDGHSYGESGGDRSPADVVGAGPEYDPGRTPDIAGDPDPADAGIEGPGSIVVGNRPPIVVGHPGPAHVCINPMPVIVRIPARLVDARLPDMTVLTLNHPASVRAQIPVEEIKRDGGTRRQRESAGK